jgi:hypothetical protein
MKPNALSTAGRLLGGGVVGLVAACASPTASATDNPNCGHSLPAAARQQLSAPGITLAFAPRPAPVPVGQPFALSVELCPAADQTLPLGLGVDAEMPAHRHGMNYRPTLKPLGGGRWRVEGLLFHMPGQWELRLDARLDGRTQALRTTVELP